MDEKERRAIELTGFMKSYIPSGWKEPIGKVCYSHLFMWYEIEAIEAFYRERHLSEASTQPDKTEANQDKAILDKFLAHAESLEW